MGLMGIQLKIAIKNEMPKEFEMIDSVNNNKTPTDQDLASTAHDGAEENRISQGDENVKEDVKKDG
jgi:hypothetical protein